MIGGESVKRGSFTTTIFNATGKIIGFLSIFLISRYFGANIKTDLYYFTNSFIILGTTVFTSLITTVFIPQFIYKDATSGSEESWRFAGALFTYALILGTLLSGLFFLFSKSLIITFSRFSPPDIEASRAVFLCFVPIPMLLIAVEFLKAITLSCKRFTYPGTLVLFSNVIMVLSIILLHNTLGVKALALALVLAQVLQALLLFVYVRKINPSFSPNFHLATNEGMAFLKHGLPVFLAQVFGSFSMFYYDFTATQFNGGTLTGIGFGQKIVALPIEIIIMPLALVIAPFLCELASTKNNKKLLDEFIKYNNMVWYLIVPFSIYFIFFSHPIVELLFKRGHFTESNVVVAANALKYFSIGLFSSSFVALNTRLIYAIQKTTAISVLAFVVGTLSIILTYVMAKVSGYIGIPLSRSISLLLFSFCPQLILTSVYFKQSIYRRLLFPLANMIVISVSAASLSMVIGSFIARLDLMHNLPALLKLPIDITFSMIMFFFLYFSFSRLMKMRESFRCFELFKTLIPYRIFS